MCVCEIKYNYCDVQIVNNMFYLRSKLITKSICVAIYTGVCVCVVCVCVYYLKI